MAGPRASGHLYVGEACNDQDAFAAGALELLPEVLEAEPADPADPDEPDDPEEEVEDEALLDLSLEEPLLDSLEVDDEDGAPAAAVAVDDAGRESLR